MSTKEEGIRLFLENIYVPKSALMEKTTLLDFLKEVNVRSFNKADEGKIGYSVLYLKTDARGVRETFKYWKIYRCDVWRISENFANIALYDDDGNAKPFKVSLNNPRFAIVC